MDRIASEMILQRVSALMDVLSRTMHCMVALSASYVDIVAVAIETNPFVPE